MSTGRSEREQELVNLYRRLYDTNAGLSSEKIKALSEGALATWIRLLKNDLHRMGVEA